MRRARKGWAHADTYIRAVALALIADGIASRAAAQPVPDAGGAPSAAPVAPQPPPAPALTPPRLLEAPALELPEGTAVPETGIELMLAIDASGAVTEATIAQSLGPDADAAVIAAAKALKFEPARRGDQPIAARIGFRFEPAPPEAQAEVPQAPSPEAAANAGAPPEPPVPVPPPEENFEADRARRQAATRRGERREAARPRAHDGAGHVRRAAARGRDAARRRAQPVRARLLPGARRRASRTRASSSTASRCRCSITSARAPRSSRRGWSSSSTSTPAAIRSRSAATPPGVIALRTAPPPADRAAGRARGRPAARERARDRAVRRRQGQRRGRVSAQLLRAAPAADHRRRHRSRTPTTSCGSTTASPTALRVSLFFFGSRDDARDRADHGRGRDRRQRRRSGLDYDFDQVILSLERKLARSVLTLRWSGTFGPVGASTSAATSTGDASLGQRHATRCASASASRRSTRRASCLQTTLGFEESVFIYDVHGSVAELRRAAGHPGARVRWASRSPFGDRLSELALAPYLEQVWRPVALRAHRRPARRVPALRRRVSAGCSIRAAWCASSCTDERQAQGSRAACSRSRRCRSSSRAARPTRSSQPNRVVAELGRHRDRAARDALEIDSTLFYSHMWQLTRPTSAPSSVDENGETSCGRSSTTTARVAPTASSCCCAGAPSAGCSAGSRTR